MVKEKKLGFTLIELLVSISIIAILVAVASVSFSAAQKKARDARRMEDIRTVAKAAETYYFLAGYVYPSTSAPPWFVPPGVAGAGDTILALFPTDPKKIGWTSYVFTNPGGTNTTYCVCAAVEAFANGNSSTSTCSFSAAGGNWFCMRNEQ